MTSMMQAKYLFFFISVMVASMPSNASNAVEILPVTIALHDQPRLQRGAKLFMNYCSGCHSLRYMRYNKMAKDIGITTFDGEVDDDLLINNLIFTKAKEPDPIEISMPATDARQWFGITPPDLSLVARKRGAGWLFTYLKSFYADKSRPFKSNNLLLPNVAMPNVLAPLAGEVIAIKVDEKNPNSDIEYLQQIIPGEMSEQEFDSALQDLVTFLVYVGEPVKLVRYKLGGFVMIFLLVFFALAYALKKNYWKKILEDKE
jgi:ubiquinol-cytochrome c reductase cytochrome c1 subunit